MYLVHPSSLEINSEQSVACLDDLSGFVGGRMDGMFIIGYRTSKSAISACKNRPTETDISYDGLTNIVDVTRA